MHKFAIFLLVLTLSDKFSWSDKHFLRLCLNLFGCCSLQNISSFFLLVIPAGYCKDTYLLSLGCLETL